MLARMNTIRLLASLLLAVPAVMVPGLQRALAQAKGAAETEDASDEGGEGEEAKVDPDQPLVTAGGNYGVRNEPYQEVLRTLLQPDGGLELRLDWFADLTSGIEFKTHTFDLLAQYGVTPMNTIRAEASLVAAAPDGVAKQKVFTIEDEQAIVYDLLDVRVGVQIPTEPDTQFDITLGFPFKYRVNNKIAIQGLERIIAIHTKSVGGSTPSPDLTFSVAGQLQIIEPLAVIVRPQIFLPAASGDNKDLSVEAAIQYTVSNQFDIGFRLILSNLTPPSSSIPTVASASALDAREFALYIRGRLPTK